MKNALPINIEYSKAIELDLENRDQVKIFENTLYYHPYFAFEYLFKANYHDPSRQLHKFSDKGVVFIDALDGKIVNDISMKQKISKLFTEEDSDFKLINECEHYNNIETYDILDDKFEIIVMDPQIQNRFSKRLAIDHITEKNMKNITYTPKSSDSILDIKSVKFKPKRKDITIKKVTFFNIPKWDITFSSGEIDYTREIYAHSGTVIEDTIKYCPQHFKLGSLKIFTKNNVAVCEVCGIALCNEHIRTCNTCGMWICYDDGILCGNCNEMYCEHHIHEKCSISKKPICESCIFVCPICGEIYGNKHTIECETCNRKVCPDCSISKGLIRKKHFCKECAEK